MKGSLLAAAVLAANTIVNANPVVEGAARFTVLTPECIRLEYQEDQQFVDEPSMFAAHRPANLPEPVVRRTAAGSLVIETERLQLTYQPDGKPFHGRNLSIRIGAGDRVVVWTPDSKQRENLGGTIHTLDQVRGPVSLEEGILSRDGWYLIDDSRTHLLVDGWAEPRPEGAGIDWFFFGYGSDYPAAFRALTAAGGKVPMPRKSVLGSWYSRWWHYTTEDYKGIVREYADNDFPLDVIVMDMEWHTGPWTGWSWNYELLEDPPALLRWFGEQGLAVTLNVHPADGVVPTETMYADFMRELGEDPASGETIEYDAANRRYMEALFKHTHHPREDEGVDFWWLDWQQYPFTKGIPDLLNLKWLNYLYFENSKRGGKRGLQFSRWGDWGDHRHPIHFSGDADTGWRMLGFEVPFTSTAGNEGAFFWSHDIGGHFGERNEETYTRWVQFAATTAAMRLHSGIIEYLDRRPWKWPAWATESMRQSFHLRSKLMPYVYTSVRQTNAESLPLNRPMYVMWPEESDAYMAPQQYMFGESLLVAPIASPGVGPGRVASQAVWFPEGEWFNFFTSEKIVGPQWRVVSADLGEWPMFVPAGAIIPSQPYSPRPATATLNELVLHLWPGPDGEENEFTLYEDDGVTSDYERGTFAETVLSATRIGDETVVLVKPTVGRYEGQPKERTVVLLLHGIQRPSEVRVNGRKARMQWDEDSRTAEVRVAEHSISKGLRIVVEAAAEDPAFFAQRALERRLAGIFGEGAPTTLKAALDRAATQPETTGAVMALAGVAYIENETHYPFVGVMQRLVRNVDSPLPADGIELRHRRVSLPSLDVIDSQRDLFSGVRGAVELQSPALLDRLIPFLSAARDERVLVVQHEGVELAATTVIAERYGQIPSWQISAPYDFDPKIPITEQVHAPEKATLEALVKMAQGKGWTTAEPASTSVVNVRALHDFDHKLAYAVGVVESPEEQQMVLGFRSDDGIEVWLNGEKIHSKDVLRGINHPWEEVPATFRKGRNVLLLKVTQGTNDWGFAVRGVPAMP